MRMLLICALAATLVGCACPRPPQVSMEGCTDSNSCLGRTASGEPIELAPSSFNGNSAAIIVKSPIKAKTEKPSSADARESAHLVIKTVKAAMIATNVEDVRVVERALVSLKIGIGPNRDQFWRADREPPALSRLAETSDSTIIKTKTAIAAKSNDLAPAESPANEKGTGLVSCYQRARVAGAICDEPRNGEVERLDCQKARAALRECFERIPPGMYARYAPSEKPAASAESNKPAGAISPGLPERAR